MAGLVVGEGFEDEPGGDPARDARLDDHEWPQVQGETPHGAREARLAIAPTREGASPEHMSSSLERLYDARPQLPEAVDRGTGPWGADEFVKVPLPMLVDVIRAGRPRHESAYAPRALGPELLPFGNLRLEVERPLDRVSDQCDCPAGGAEPALAQS
jgi:hypothetical protein